MVTSVDTFEISVKVAALGERIADLHLSLVVINCRLEITGMILLHHCYGWPSNAISLETLENLVLHRFSRT